MVTNYEGNSFEFKETLPLLPVRDIVVYPFMILPLFVGRESSIKAVEQSLSQFDRLIFLSSQKDIHAEVPSPNEIFEIGTVAMIMRMRKLPDGRIKILIQGLSKARITQFLHTDPFYKVKLAEVHNISVDNNPLAVEALIRNVKDQLEKVISVGKVLSSDILMVLEDISDPGRLADLIASNLNLKVDEAQIILETVDPLERLQKISDILARELDILSMQAKIKNVSKDESSKNQKESFLREQIKALKNELGEDGQEKNDDFQELREKIANAKMPAEVEKEALKQIHRLEKMHPDSSEASILRTYLDLMVELPWSNHSQEISDLVFAKKVLDEDHFELHKIKERVLEYLAVRQLKGRALKGPIICFAGPPGVGKTSLGKSIAKATGREFVRMSLGGIKDEAEIRGHRRTYVGSMPGRFIQALKQAGTNNPVILLDEIDKLASDLRGDPSSALLEVLDPEQNNSFRDHYLNVPFDLSNVMFIATANVLESIPTPLRDRMEILNLSGYTQEEKVAITKKYLIPKQIEENGIKLSDIEIDDNAIISLVKNYTHEAGLRNLERCVGAVCRKVAKKVVDGNTEKFVVNAKAVEDLLGPPVFSRDEDKREDEVGVVSGLAVTSVGGEVLLIEVSKMKGRGFTFTGQLGDVMKESAQAAIGYIRSNAAELGINEDFFDSYELHIHLPSGAVPKDGPSAGIALATGIVSLLTNRKVSRNIAMTGEITLTGKVLPIGGLKDKALAAMRLGISKVIVPAKNKKDLSDIPEEFKNKIEFVLVKHISEVFEHALIFDEDESEKFKQSTEKKKDKTKHRLAA